MASSTFNPNTGGGRLVSAVNASFNTVHNAASANSNDATAEIASTFSGGVYIAFRAFLPFDTSSLPDNATVTSATLQLYRDDSGDGFVNADSTSAELVPETQASNTAIANSDYSQLIFTSFGSVNFSATTNHVYSTINITDLTQVSLTGHTKIAVITGRDRTNTAPTGQNQIYFHGRSDANPPILTVNYTVPGGGAFLQFFI